MLVVAATRSAAAATRAARVIFIISLVGWATKAKHFRVTLRTDAVLHVMVEPAARIAAESSALREPWFSRGPQQRGPVRWRADLQRKSRSFWMARAAEHVRGREGVAQKMNRCLNLHNFFLSIYAVCV